MNRSKKTSRIGITITIVVLIVIVIISNIKIEDMSNVENGFGVLVMPIQNGLTYLKNWMSGNDSFFTNVGTLEKDNEELREKNSELEKKLRELEVIKSENEVLREYVNLKDKYTNYQSIPGYVINKDISNYSNVVIINIGAKDGVRINMPVIAEEGLVGHIISVTDSTAKVQTIVDTASTISCNISNSNDSLIARGTLDKESNLKATYIPTDATILEGDKIETSGLGGIYPRGIYIGTVKKVISTQNITDRYAIIQTAVDFKKLDTVLVITQ